LAAAAAVLAGSRRAAAAKLNAAKTSYRLANEKLTPYSIVTGYNNFYEFGTDKEQPVRLARDFRTSPWTIRLEGDVAKPKTLDLDTVLKLAPLEERIYRHRCVEGWSIVVPWIGFPLSALLKQAEPTGKAKYVALESFTIQNRCGRPRGPAFRFLMWKVCGWTRRCIP